MSETTEKGLHFIESIVADDLETGKHPAILTRFPPEPNGFLHIGHAKSICLNFGLAAKYGGKTNLRFDDTNPEKEDTAYVDSIKEDVAWLGFDWDGEPRFTSDYFDTLYGYAVKLIQEGKAYVDEQTSEEIAKQKGTPTNAGSNSPFRDRSPEENLARFKQMKNGEVEAGKAVLRAKIDMSHPNMHMRDPFIYRVKFATHHRTGDSWCIYPMYDFAHGQSDSVENITHSLCTLEFEVHRPLYNWLIENLEIFPSRQIEFARLELNYTVISKRKLIQLVENELVEGWDDPRMPTISGMRRRGYPAAAIRNFCDRIGIAKRKYVTDISILEQSVREELNKTAPRVMAVLDPVKVVITNYPEGQTEMLPIINNPEDESMGARELPFGREIWIERNDFMLDPPKKYFRLAPNKTVRLKAAYIIECEEYDMDADGNITELRCKYYPDSKSGSDTSGVKVKGVIHWVSCGHAFDADVRQYDRLFNDENPDGHEGVDFKEFINADSLKVLSHCKMEPSLSEAKSGDTFQFQRLGYFSVDSVHSQEGNPVFNRSVTLKDTWAKVQGKN